MFDLQYFLIGIIQGITEFVPISSSGHLVLFAQLTNWEDQGLFTDIAVHFGTLFAVLLYLRKDIYYFLRNIFQFKIFEDQIILKVILECLLKWFAPILSFTTEEIYHLINKEDVDGSIHLQKFVKIPNQWKNEELNNKWDKLKLIRDEANISIESKRADKIIGSSLEANIEIKIKDKDMYSLAQNHDFSEICITSSASILRDSSLEKEIEITSSKAVGNKCPVCWKISKEICEKHGHLSVQ